MKIRLGAIGIILFAVAFLSACAVAPRVSSWDNPYPNRFTQSQVFDAALQAGADMGYSTTSSDRQSGTMSFMQHVGDGTMVLSVRVIASGGNVGVRTTANYGGGLAVAGLHEEVIHNFHVYMFRHLNIAGASELNNVRITDSR